ncbi:exonuclease domain-containing protein [Vibrio cholerae]|uniref:3'-5' exonuclease n=1 Tax=Gammaproteobacteria TaxID=1236 RepID=UPI00051173DB|nr:MULTISPECIES: 3'-5' exonuclease [Gammaproteobacteria]EGR4179701.1 3'-5' exonuclease [Vibrio cholerae]EJL6325321.1 3'-5' exonuclease [Vibrio cholerae]EJL6768890.1 3'-5' exonuclease [Vibrio cholerae]ELH4196994.1 3'-5' exonuclease [Vibrio cholerae]MBW5432260.1 3'-5' exonuclease [Vibrio cholerae]
MNETFISVDIEASGPVPGEFSMLSVGACLVYEPTKTFERVLKPITMNFDPEALAVTGFDLDELTRSGQTPEECMRAFADWLQAAVPSGSKPIFVGLNAAFDWSFVNYYFIKFFGVNPFGFAPLDIKAMYMGVFGCAWKETKASLMSKALNAQLQGNHNALTDAVFQAELFRLVHQKLTIQKRD